MGKQKDRQYGTLEGQPPFGPRRHLLEREQVQQDKIPKDKDEPGEPEPSGQPAYGRTRKHP